jgi:hypothetical protein
MSRRFYIGTVLAAVMAAGVATAGLPARVALTGFKQEQVSEVHAAGRDSVFGCIGAYPLLATSGGPGPKLRGGDRQVTEGIYRISLFDPNRRFHPSLRIDYPRARDRARANPGGDILIHGKGVSVGSLAVGDEAAQELFAPAALTGIGNIRVVLSPVDFRARDLPAAHRPAVSWADRSCGAIRAGLAKYPRFG